MKLYFIIGLISMIITRCQPGYMKGFKEGFDESFAENPNAVKASEYLDEKSMKTVYKVSLFVGILLDIIDEILIWPVRILSRIF